MLPAPLRANVDSDGSGEQYAGRDRSDDVGNEEEDDR